MPLLKRSSVRLDNFDIPVSLRINEERTRLRDAINMFSNQGRLETRYGFSRFISSSLGSKILSISFFKKTDGTRYFIAKSDTALYKIEEDGSTATIKTGLTSTTKHKGVTLNNRHIIAVENDGLFSWDGTTFTQLGEDPPSAPSVAVASGGSLPDATEFKVGLTFYASGIGFETNVVESSNVTTATPNLQINVTSIPTTANNALIDKVRVYLKDVTNNSNYLFISEISLGTSSTTITAESTSTQVPPTTHAKPLSGGGKFLTKFNRRLVYAGNSTFKNDVFFSEVDLPDAFDDTSSQLVLNIPGDGDITGIATGFYNDSALDPYLIIFKKRSTHLYSELAGQAKFVTLNDQIGCVSNNTIIERNGDVYWLSADGWRVIENGRLVSNKKGNPLTLGDGDIDDIFKDPGYVYEVNKLQFENTFSVFYSTLDHYMTWVAEGSNTSLDKTWVYEYNVKGFKPFKFNIAATSAATGEDQNGEEIVLFGDDDGWLYSYSIDESRQDVDSDNTATAIRTFAQLIWVAGKDMDASYNFRELIVRALTSSNTVTVNAAVNYDSSDTLPYEYDFSGGRGGFILDFSKLDEAFFGDGRNIVTARNDLNRVGENIMIGFFQETLGANMALVSAQLDFSKNGNRN